jgi:Na+-transporting NADH:ubiquinone oxidoreductase subunit NqrE
MNEVLSNATLSATAIVPIIVALVQMFKMTTWVKDRFAPFLAVALGIFLAFLFSNDMGQNWSHIIFTGIIYGLSSSGLYSGIKTTSEAIKMDRMKENQKKNLDNKHKK